MAMFYVEGERKKRAGVYQRYSKRGQDPVPGALVGVVSVTIQADWGPLGVVNTFYTDNQDDVKKVYGTGGTVDAVAEIFAGGAQEVHVIRIGTEAENSKSNLVLKDGADAEVIKVEAKYPGTKVFNIAVQEKLSDATIKQFIVYEDTTKVETLEFAAGEGELEALLAAAANSPYITLTKIADGNGVIAVLANTPMTAGINPAVTNETYSDAFNALEPYDANTLVTDTDDKAVHDLLAVYINRVYRGGKNITATIGCDAINMDMATRYANAKSYNNELVNYFGHYWEDSNGAIVSGYKAIARVAGYIASTPSNKSIVHKVINGAVTLPERLTNAQYEDAIDNGCLMLSISPDKAIWFDSGINTRTVLEDNQDAGWKKIKRTAVRNEAMSRIDQAIAMKTGKVNNDSDGQADVKQAALNVLNLMAVEKKILPGATFELDPQNPAQGDESWWVIEMDDIDTMEKIYLHYRYRYSPLV